MKWGGNLVALSGSNRVQPVTIIKPDVLRVQFISFRRMTEKQIKLDVLRVGAQTANIVFTRCYLNFLALDSVVHKEKMTPLKKPRVSP